MNGKKSSDETTVLTQNRPVQKDVIGVGSRLKDRFILEEEIGRGGMGVVYRALDLRKQEAEDREPYIAIKLISTNLKETKESLISLQREAKKSQKLAHPNVATVYDFDRDGNDAYLCMELLEGEPLSDFLKKQVNRGLPFAEALPIIRGMAQGLAYAHEENIVHSDFKPGNIFITNKGNVKILDFGIARAFTPANQDKDHTVFDAGIWGAITPRYASPEMFLKEPPDPRDDIYALGCVAYQLLTGKHPYDGKTAIKAIEAQQSPPTVKGLSRQANLALQKSVALSREKRSNNIAEFLQGLEPQEKKSNNLWVVSSVATVLLGFALMIWMQINNNKEIANAGAETSPWQANERAVEAQTQIKIKRLLDVAIAHASIGRYISPPTSNAAEVYMAILELQPGNTQALEMANAIADAVVQKVQRLQASELNNEALQTMNEALSVLPDHPKLLALLDKLN